MSWEDRLKRARSIPNDEVTSSTMLLKRFRNGDHSAAATLFERHLPKVREMARARLMANGLREVMDSQDLMQDALIKAYRALDRLEIDEEGQFLAWLARIVQNTVIDAARAVSSQKRDRNQVMSDPAAKAAALAISSIRTPTPSEVSMGREIAEQYFEALSSLKEKYREVILLRRHAGCSYAQIAKELHLAGEAQARTLFSRAMARLTTQMSL